ncbi:MAG: TIGR04219 family outer membrane beta-barrel protein, partial [Gammaproteobacteria bacterium]|nr:TIGR04219 family outer membrane beta-barrel protein [Gammaproteobacteria bacterium]
GAGTTGDVNMVYGGIDATLKTDIDLDHMDYTLYWEVIDTGMDLDIGLTARRFDGSLTQEVYSNLVPGTVLGSQVQPIEGTIPMLYINARVELPFTGFYVGGEINSLSYQGDGFNDLTAKVGWSTDSWIMPEFGVELGYRKMSLDIDASNKLDTTLDLSIDGYYLALVGHF